MSIENGLPTDTDLMMEARYYADEISRGTKGVSRAKTLALADGFRICDRQRAEATIRAQTAEAALRSHPPLSAEDKRLILEWLREGESSEAVLVVCRVLKNLIGGG